MASTLSASAASAVSARSLRSAPARSRRGAVSARASVSEPEKKSDASSEVSIRRRPPNGQSLHNVGTDQFAFKMEAVTPEGDRVDNEDNKPRNILEEIVWHKDVELAKRKDAFPLALVAP